MDDAGAAQGNPILARALVCAGAGVPAQRTIRTVCAAQARTFLALIIARGRLWPASLWLVRAQCPTCFYLFGVVLLVWIVLTRSYRILLGGALAVGASCAVSWWMDPLAWGQYRQMLHTSGIEWEFIPCFSVMLRIWFGQGSIWLQYVPALIACIWALWWFWRRRHTWDWLTDGSLLMLVSIVAAPYSWLFDQCLAIPALLRGAYLTRFRSLLVTLALLSSLIELAMFGNLLKPSAVYLWTLWAAPAWLAWYLVVTIAERWSADWPNLRLRTWLRNRRAAGGDRIWL